LLKLTIVPRSKGSLGFAQYLPSDKKIFTRQNMVDQIAVILGGRAS
jgi:AFG3 family protein